MKGAKVLLDLIPVQMNGWRNDVARQLMPDLDDVFAKVCFDGLDAFRLQGGVEPDLLRDHGLALGDGFCACVAAKLENDLTRLGSIARPMDMSPRCNHLALIVFEEDVEVIEHVVLDAGRDGAQFVEFGQRGAGFGALGDEPRLDVAQSTLKLRVLECARCVLFEIQRGRLHCCSRWVNATDRSLKQNLEVICWRPPVKLE